MKRQENYKETTRMDWSLITPAVDILIEKLNKERHQRLKKILLRHYNSFIAYAKIIKSGEGHPNEKITLLKQTYLATHEALEQSEYLKKYTGNFSIKSFYLSALKAVYLRELKFLAELQKDSRSFKAKNFDKRGKLIDPSTLIPSGQQLKERG